MNDNEREMDLALAEAEQENRLLRARNERLERELAGQVALNKMAENARELGLDYEPAVQEGRDWSLLEATQESLREHMAEIKRLKAAQPAPVQDEFDIRGMLASKLTCWNRLKETEANELVALVASLSQPAPVQSCYCPNCEAMGKELAALKAQPAPVQELTNLQRHEQNVQKFLAAQPTPVQEPVACVQDLDEVKRKHLVYEKGMDWKDPLYTTPPAAQQGLDWKAEYLKSVESGCITLDELREANAELDATNRQVEILSDALAESRREIDVMIALARADEREECLSVIKPNATPMEIAVAIRARGQG